MSIVPRNRIRRKPVSPAVSWDDRIELAAPADWPDYLGLVDVPMSLADPDRVDAEEGYYRSINRVGHAGDCPAGGADSAVSPVDWLRSRVAAHKSLSREDGDYQDLVGTVVNDVLCTMQGVPAGSARKLVSRAGNPYRGIDLDAVALPPIRDSHAAELLDEQAGIYLALGGDLARLVAAAILRRANDVQSLGADTLRDYYLLEAARLEAAMTVSEETGVPYDGPLD
jgi:hypothetical protein